MAIDSSTKLIKELSKILNLKDWDITLKFFDDLSYLQLSGSIDFKDYGSKKATINLNINDEDEYTIIIIHEMVHILILESNIENIPLIVENYLPEPLFETMKSQQTHYIEYLVNSLTEIIKKNVIN